MHDPMISDTIIINNVSRVMGTRTRYADPMLVLIITWPGGNLQPAVVGLATSQSVQLSCMSG